MPRRHQKPESTKHREGDFMYYTYYHEFKTKDGEIVYHKNCCKKRIRKNNNREDTPRMIKKKKERLILELKKKLLTAVNSFSLLDLETIIKIAERDPVFIVKTIATHGDSANNGGSGSVSGSIGTDCGGYGGNTIKARAYSDNDSISTGDSTDNGSTGGGSDNGSTDNGSNDSISTGDSTDNDNIRSRL